MVADSPVQSSMIGLCEEERLWETRDFKSHYSFIDCSEIGGTIYYLFVIGLYQSYIPCVVR